MNDHNENFRAACLVIAGLIVGAILFIGATVGAVYRG